MKTDIILPNKEVYAKFKLTFGTDLADYKDVLMMVITRRFAFDIFGFEKYCRQLGYSEDKYGSLNVFVKNKFGEDASRLIIDLLNF